jgi:glutathione S-transferase
MSGQLRLVYWPARGLVESTRMMCAISGTTFVDERHPTGCADATVIDANLGRMPVLVTPEGVSIGQSAAINNYIASTQGFLGSSPTEAAQVVNWMESLTELNAVWSKLVPYGTEPTAEAYAAFFDDKTAADVTGVADRAAASKRAAHWFLGRLERLTSAHGPFAVGNKLSLADVALFRLLGDVVSRDETNKDVPAYRLEPYGSAERTAALLASYPKIAAIVENVRANKNLQVYLAARPKHA